jgi:hypothetical protein
MIKDVIEFINNVDYQNKQQLIQYIQLRFELTKDRSVFYNNHFAIRFSQAKTESFANTVLSISSLRKFDNKPFIVCLILPNNPKKNRFFLANSTFLRKISHSSQELRLNNIKGSFNGSDIVKEFCGIANEPENFDELFTIHQSISFEENLIRLVDSTNSIVPSGIKFQESIGNIPIILQAPIRALKFIESQEYSILNNELIALVRKYSKEILLASLIENVNIRGRVIEFLISGNDAELKKQLIHSLRHKTTFPAITTENNLGDYIRVFENKFSTATDIKTKILILSSNPKAYNIDKVLEFLAKESTVFLFFFVGIDFSNMINTRLVSIFHNELLEGTLLLKHWSGRNSRGVTQLKGSTIDILFQEENFANSIKIAEAQTFLQKLIEL